MSTDERPILPNRFRFFPIGKTLRPRAAPAIVLAVLWIAIPMGAQERGKPAPETTPTPAVDHRPDPTIAEVEARIARMEADPGLEEAVKDNLRAKYREAVESLKAAAEFHAKAAAFARTFQTAPTETEAVRAEIEALPAAEAVVSQLQIPEKAGDSQKEIDSRQNALDLLKGSLDKVEKDLSRLQTRPLEIGARLPEARRELEEVRTRLEPPDLAPDPASPGRLADSTAAEAMEARLAAESSSLEKEQRSQGRYRELLQARGELLRRQIENETAVIAALKAAVNRDLVREAKEAMSEAGATLRETSEESAELRELAAEADSLAREFESVVRRLKKTSAEQDLVDGRLEKLTREIDLVRKQLEMGRAGRLMARSLFDLRQRLPGRFALAQQVQQRREELGGARLESLEIEEKLRTRSDHAVALAGVDSESAQRLLSSRNDLLKKLETHYDTLVRSLSALAIDEAEYLDLVRQTVDYLDHELFWVRSSPPLGQGALTGLPAAIGAVFGKRVWGELAGAIVAAPARAPLPSLSILMALAALLLARPALGKALRKRGEATRKISTDRYAHTVRALLYTILLALPIPLALLACGWALRQAPDLSEWGRAARSGLMWSAVLAFPFLLTADVCRPGGLGEKHFRWRSDIVRKIRSAVLGFALLSAPALLLVRMSFTGDAGEYFDSLGLITFVIVSGLAAWILGRLFWSGGGIPSAPERSNAVRLASLGFGLAVLSPVVLLILAMAGYLYTAAVSSVALVASAAVAGVGAMVYWLALRWFRIRERRLALGEALEERKARREAAAKESEEDVGEPDEMVTIEVEEREMDLSDSSRQTRRLLAFLCGLGALLALGFLWSQTIPLFSELDKIRFGGGPSLLGLAKAVLVAALTVTATRNLPGFLELAAFRMLELQPGTRVALVTLCQYALIASGLVVLFNILEVEWAKFGWIAAALSVGIGFGLQEVVANFVCGLILLFERPIRVGDIVTVEGTTGTVSRIQMRATTIINWDRQELVVPNKAFVTGTILNWTLSTTINRIVITVGVAYGSDTENARRILLEIASDHPLVLADPAPMATFEEFADSSLTLLLRCYLPNLDNRVATINDLHTAIARRFAEAGIEIAFPRLDVHLRSVAAAQSGAM